MTKTMIMEGSMAVAQSIKACRPGVISVFPISPQTHIVEELAQLKANDELSAKLVRADSEFSAASVIYGASATGVRAYTASSSQGILLMSEVLYALAGTRLPVVITGVNRTVSAPITIQPDHQDSMAIRDTGIIQIHVENCQEAYAAHIQAFKIAEDHEVLLPVMVCMDGWILTHSYEPVRLEDQDKIDGYLPSYVPKYCLDTKRPLTYGSFADEEVQEFRLMMHFAMDVAKQKIEDAANEYKSIFGDYFGGLIEAYSCEDADVIIMAMGSVIGTIKDAVDKIRAKGTKVGVLKVRTYRPFPDEAIKNAVKNAKIVAVLDKSLSIGRGGPLAIDVKSAFYNGKMPPVLSCIAGMGGRDVTINTIEKIVEKSLACLENDSIPDIEYIDFKPQYLE